MAQSELEAQLRQAEQKLLSMQYQLGLILAQLAAAQQAVLVLTGGARN